jgi:short-subunit dehydrogenase
MARQLAPRARTLVLVARRRERMEELKGELCAKNPRLKVVVCAYDLGDLAQIDALLSAAKAEAGEIDVLINNAGFGDLGVFDRADWGKTRRMIDLNVTSLTYLTHRLAGSMVERGRGGILNVSSGWGMTFAPGLAAYIATKHYVTGFTEALRLDLRGTGVVVTQVCPGPVATEFEENVGNFTGQKVPGIVEISAETCARSALRGFSRGRALVVPGLVFKIVMAIGVLSPRFLTRLVMGPVARALRKKQLAASAP